MSTPVLDLRGNLPFRVGSTLLQLVDCGGGRYLFALYVSLEDMRTIATFVIAR